MEFGAVSRNQVFKNSAWKFAESCGVQLLQLVVTIILARILSPDDYGLMAIVLVVINFTGLFINSSISSYLVYIRDIKKQDILTALLTNVILSLGLISLLYFAALPISTFYGEPKLVILIRVLSIILPFNSISSIYNAYAIKASQHKALFIRNMIAIPISGIVALIAAYVGLGIWAIVLQQIVYSILLAIIIVISIKIKVNGQWKFDFTSLGAMLNYGGATFLSSVIAFISDNINEIIIGKKINSEQLAYYNRGNAFPSMLANIINSLSSSVFFPAFSSYNTKVTILKDKCRYTIRTLYFLVTPIFLGLIACAESFVLAFLTDKWVSAISIIQILSLYFLTIPVLQISSQVYLAVSSLRVRTVGEFLKMLVSIIVLLVFVRYGIYAVAWSRVLVAMIMVVYTIIVNYYIIDYKFSELICDIYKPILLSAIMLIIIYPFNYLHWAPLLILIVQISLGVVIYIIGAKIFKINEFDEIFNFVFARFH